MAVNPPPLQRIDPAAPAPALVAAAAAALLAGELIVLPTETVYGLAADPRNPAALARIFEAKGRDAGKPVALLISDPAQLAGEGASFPPVARRLAGAFWPGPLTLVLDGPAGTIGVRWPDHPVPLAVIRRFGRPIGATSANRSGEPEARTAAEAAAALGATVALILDGGPVHEMAPSTVVRVEASGAWRVLRAGAIPAEKIQAVAEAAD